MSTMEPELEVKKPETEQGTYSLDYYQRVALGGMLILTLLTFVGANLHALLWQSSQWLVSTVLPAVVVELTNEERADLGETTLRRSAVLDEAARMKAQHMANNQYFAHYAPDGTSPWFWFDKAGYTYAHAGENLAIHFTDSTEVVDAWMKSPTHRENIVSGKFTEIGVGTAKGTYEGYETVYVVQLFGAPAQKPVVKTTPAAAPAPTPTPKPVPAALAQTAPAETETSPVVLAETEEVVTQEVTALEDDTPEQPAEDDIVVVAAPSESEENTVTEAGDDVLIQKEMVSTSSGLAIANIVQDPETASKSSVAGLATKPGALLQIIYTLFGVIVIGLLITSIIVEARSTHYVKMAYGIGLLVILVGLWFIHSLLTTGAIII